MNIKDYLWDYAIAQIYSTRKWENLWLTWNLLEHDLIILTKDSWDNHLNQLRTVFSRLRDAGLKIHAKKSFFGRTELEYLGYWITREGVQPLPKKVQAILNIKSSTNKKQLRSFIGMVNYYRDMWVHISEILAPLAALTAKTIPWKWTEIHEKSF